MLVLNAALILMYPLPDTLNERFTSNFVPISSLAGKQAFNYGLCRYTSMIFTGNPKGVITLHSMIPNNNIFDRSSYGVSEVQRSCHIWRRHTDDKCWTSHVTIWFEVTAFLPEPVPFSFN